MDGVTSVYDAWHVIFRVRKRVCRRYGVLQRKICLSGQRRASVTQQTGLHPQGEEATNPDADRTTTGQKKKYIFIGIF